MEDKIINDEGLTASRYERAWKHWYPQMGHLCNTIEEWDLYKQVEKMVLRKIDNVKAGKSFEECQSKTLNKSRGH